MNTGFPRILFNFTGDRQKIIGINQWGTSAWSSMSSAFAGCSNLNAATGTAQDAPDLNNVPQLDAMFSAATVFNQAFSRHRKLTWPKSL